MNFKVGILFIFYVLIFASCFKEDEPVPPYVPPEDVETAYILNSIYYDQVYFDFSSGQIMAVNAISDWVLGFECGAGDYQIRVNSSNFWGVAPTGSKNIDSVYSSKTPYTWKSDKSDGNPDSTAVGKWVSNDSGIPMYSKEVFLLGQFDGISYKAVKKVQFIYVDESYYKFKVAGLTESQADTITIYKDSLYNCVQYSLETNGIVQLEPNKEEWDILFTQYFTILFTDDGIPSPYFVRGVLQNPYKVETALDTIAKFSDINYTIASSNVFSKAQDAIGYDWKSVEVDEGSNSAEYTVRPGYTYIVKDTDGDLFKFRFKSFFNSSGVKGYPSFEYTKLIPE
ncbi:MAG: HmuY family protein [Bacteroidales bacterium]|nr:HmuY family protein [Bacteroidales bacterium]MCF8389868.1 HmuY family protein [Bacteroidales bacterium]